MAWLYAYDQEDLAITGPGSLVGNSEELTAQVNAHYRAGRGLPRPTLVYLENCRRVRLEGFTLTKAPFWAIHPAGCEDLLIRGLRIQSDPGCANSDGIDPDHCRRVLIEDCSIDSADDCIAIKNTRGNAEYGPSEDIRIRNCRLRSSSAAIKLGTESVDDFRRIEVEDCAIEDSNRGISIQLRDGGRAEDLRFRRIRIATRMYPPAWWGSGEPIALTLRPRHPLGPCGRLDRLEFSDIECRGEKGLLVYASRAGRLGMIAFRRIQFTPLEPGPAHRRGHDLRPGLGRRSLTGARDGAALLVRRAPGLEAEPELLRPRSRSQGRG
jgi:hypothetical protein